MLQKHKRMLWLAAGLAAATPAWSLDLLQAYETALAQDATVRAARAAADAGRERLPQARAQLLPNLAYSGQRNVNDLTRDQPNSLGVPTVFKDQYNSLNQTLTLRQPLFRLSLWANYQQAQYVVDDVNAVLERELKNLSVRVATAYMEALLAKDQLDLVLAQKVFVTTQLDVAKKTFAAGSGTRTDIDEARARLDMNLAQELEARQNLEFTRRQLEVLISRPVDQIEPLNVKRMPLLDPQPALLSDWIDRAEQANPDIVSLRARAQAARLEVNKAQGGHFPTVDAVAQWVNSSSENVNTPNSSYTNKTLGIQVSVPLFSGGYVSSTVRQAVAEQQRADETLEAARLDLGVRVHKEFRNVTEGIAKVRALEQAVASAELLARSTRKSFEAGSRTLSDVLNTEQQKQLTLRDLAQARYLYMSARIRLFALAGEDPRTGIEQTNAWLGE
ncbi:MAG: TolC family outer membrane protein [Burkholderiaceae bacterium]|nr:TolC family outer membrane protein [Burkholderiaceae bacterium]